MFDLQVDGQVLKLTRDEIIKLASKAAGADRKFSEAAEIRKKAGKGLQLLEVMDAVRAGTATQEQVDMILENFGVDPANVEGYDRMFGNQTPPAANRNQQQPAAGSEPIGMDDLDPRIRATLKAAEEQELKATRMDIESKTRAALDGDSVLGKMLDGLSGEKKKAVMDELFDLAMMDVREGIVIRNQLFGTEMLNDSIQRLRHRVERLGIPMAKDSHPSVGAGVGPMQYGAGNPRMWQVPDKEVPRVSSADASWEKNTVMRALQAQQKAFSTENRR